MVDAQKILRCDSVEMRSEHHTKRNVFVNLRRTLDSVCGEIKKIGIQICKKSIDTWRWIRSKRAQNLPVGCFNSVNMFFLEGTTGIRNH